MEVPPQKAGVYGRDSTRFETLVQKRAAVELGGVGAEGDDFIVILYFLVIITI